MKKLVLFGALALMMGFSTFAENSIVSNTIINNKSVLLPESCFSYIHGLYTEYYGGVNLDNLADFLDAVANCEASLE